MSRRAAAFIGLLALWPAGPEVLAGAPRLTPLALPGGERGVGFDDLVYSASLGRVLAPAGRSGRLDLVDPKTFKVEAIGGFTSADRFRGGHGKGTTSADSGAGLLFATDRDRRMVMLVDPRAKKIVGGAELAGSPDYVRWVEPQREVWVTEPDKEGI